MNLIFMVIMGLAFLCAAFVGATINQYQLFPGARNRDRILQALILFDCIMAVFIVWTIPLWAPTWLR